MNTEKTKQAIKQEIEKFQTLAREDITIKSDSVDEGRFKIVINGADAGVVVAHEWDNPKGSYTNPGVISVLLSDSTNLKSYVIYMTESKLEDFPELLENAFVIAQRFLGSQFLVERPKWFSLSRKTNLFFDDPKLVYKYATQTNKYKEIS